MEGEVDFRVDGVDKPCKTWYKVFGDFNASQHRPLVVLHGGPGAPHSYLLSLADLVSTHSIPIVLYDQLGNGNSTHLPDKKGDAGFWTEDLFIGQLEHLLQHLGIQGDFDLLGHSWGGMLAARLATRHPPGLKCLVLMNSLASMHLWVEATRRLRSQLPDDVQATLDKHETDGTTDSKEYQDAAGVFYARHLCRLDPWPEDVASALEQMQEDPTVHMTLIGPSEFFIAGSLKDWSIVDDIWHEINVPTLLLNGRYDEAQNSVNVPFFRALSKVKWVPFSESSHMPQHEERERFMQVVGDFLTQGIQVMQSTGNDVRHGCRLQT